ncbi:hypothetical protein FLK61_34875 [Paenalkalicoccus suaedae]|uniref:Fimbrial assembly protein n=1 Tax=Paenalkalicoccus suaedae TaxID=2592382 RepID=A0A859FGS5_9BACI|nr:hypothetical protein [Paenalkalicoccus suaedae]QKS71854.1 hypothetical protein FLK61_34875 [Paenalkalicoccus suaedae]
MAVEINLLPHQSKRDRTFSLSLILVGSIGIIGLIVLLFLGNQVEDNRMAKEAELTEARVETTMLEQELSELDPADGGELGQKIEELENKRVPSFAVLSTIVAAMPEEGNITLFDYTFPADIEMEIVLTSMSDIAQFQYNLEQSPMIQEANVEAVLGEDIEEEVEEDPFWYETYIPQYFTTYRLVLHPDAVRAYSDEQEDEVVLP